ncbi:MAG: TetR/AcrR family transcriptional regulator [Eubacteriales bacterium]|nr:TetR/AcrR family transcriptional regulator [Eubacteriales bacterium]
MTNRQLAAQETKRKLLASAKQIICEKGLANTSVEEITAAAGVSKGTFYTYFRQKEEIVFELSSFMFDEILNRAKSHEGPFRERLRQYMVEFSDYIEKGSVRLAQEWIRNVVNPPITENGNGLSKWRLDTSCVEDLLRTGICEGQLKKELPIETLTPIIVELLYGQLLCWCINDGAYSLRERTEEFCSKYLDELLKPYEEDQK